MILDEGIRLDGRKTTEIRPIWCEVDYLPAAHGSVQMPPPRAPLKPQVADNGNARYEVGRETDATTY